MGETLRNLFNTLLEQKLEIAGHAVPLLAVIVAALVLLIVLILIVRAIRRRSAAKMTVPKATPKHMSPR